MSAPKGHWFCDHCDDIVFMSFERWTQTNVPCPKCGRPECNFIPRTLSREILPAEWFNAMRKLVDQATNPELPSAVHHKKLL